MIPDHSLVHELRCDRFLMSDSWTGPSIQLAFCVNFLKTQRFLLKLNKFLLIWKTWILDRVEQSLAFPAVEGPGLQLNWLFIQTRSFDVSCKVAVSILVSVRLIWISMPDFQASLTCFGIFKGEVGHRFRIVVREGLFVKLKDVMHAPFGPWKRNDSGWHRI